MNFTRRRTQRGITLIESLIALVVAALGILGVIGVQMRTLTDTSTTVRRAQAIRLIEDLGERMKVNPNAMSNIASYISAFDDNPTPGNCSNKCSPSQQTAYDLAIWKQTVSNVLPAGQASIFLPPAETVAANRRQLGILIAWRENEIDVQNTDDKAKYKDNIDATQVRAADGGLSAGGGTDKTVNACPDGFTCHLQYLPVAARCAPYNNGSSFVFYCS